MRGDLLGTWSARLACSLLPPVVGRLEPSDRVLALTIDDGPSPGAAELAEMLKDEGVPATWFMVGCRAERREEALGAIVAAGHSFGNHGYDHVDAWRASASRAVGDLESGLTATERLTGRPISCTRPPFGRLRPATLEWCRKAAQRVVLWDVLAADYRHPANEAAISDRIRSTVRPGSIVAMHDHGTGRQIELFRRVIGDLRQDGWAFAGLNVRT